MTKLTTGTKEYDVSDTGRQVLIVEDEPDQQELLKFNLSKAGYDVHCADNGREALEMIRRSTPDMMLLDLMLPGMDRLEVCRHVRRDPATANVPIIMLTAKAEDSDVVAGLELGADDYITKPYSPRILLARVRAVLRMRKRGSGATMNAGGEQVIRHKDLVIKPERFEVTVANKPVSLSGTEFRILSLLAGRPGRVFTREQMIRSVHGENCAVTDRSVDVHIFWLRQKLGSRGHMVEAVRGVGYRFKEAAD